MSTLIADMLRDAAAWLWPSHDHTRLEFMRHALVDSLHGTGLGDSANTEFRALLKAHDVSYDEFMEMMEMMESTDATVKAKAKLLRGNARTVNFGTQYDMMASRRCTSNAFRTPTVLPVR
jgi:hypothetical protein